MKQTVVWHYTYLLASNRNEHAKTAALVPLLDTRCLPQHTFVLVLFIRNRWRFMYETRVFIATLQ